MLAMMHGNDGVYPQGTRCLSPRRQIPFRWGLYPELRKRRGVRSPSDSPPDLSPGDRSFYVRLGRHCVCGTVKEGIGQLCDTDQ